VCFSLLVSLSSRFLCIVVAHRPRLCALVIVSLQYIISCYCSFSDVKIHSDICGQDCVLQSQTSCIEFDVCICAICIMHLWVGSAQTRFLCTTTIHRNLAFVVKILRCIKLLHLNFKIVYLLV
jgi:hypothetical protein